MIESNPNATHLIVVNEPYLNCDCGREYDPFYKSWGNSYDYIVEAFETARVINPSIDLIYNDTDNHRANGGTTQITRAIVGKLHKKGLVDYVGMQMHFNQWGGVIDGKVDTATIFNETTYYRNMGVPVLITKLTYEPTEIELKLPDKEFNERLSTIFEQVIKVAIESGNVKGITFWGVTDKYIQDINWYMIIDEKGQPKQSYYVVLKTLYEGVK